MHKTSIVAILSFSLLACDEASVASIDQTSLEIGRPRDLVAEVSVNERVRQQAAELAATGWTVHWEDGTVEEIQIPEPPPEANAPSSFQRVAFPMTATVGSDTAHAELVVAVAPGQELDIAVDPTDELTTNVLGDADRHLTDTLAATWGCVYVERTGWKGACWHKGGAYYVKRARVGPKNGRSSMWASWKGAGVACPQPTTSTGTAEVCGVVPKPWTNSGL